MNPYPSPRITSPSKVRTGAGVGGLEVEISGTVRTPSGAGQTAHRKGQAESSVDTTATSLKNQCFLSSQGKRVQGRFPCRTAKTGMHAHRCKNCLNSQTERFPAVCLKSGSPTIISKIRKMGHTGQQRKDMLHSSACPCGVVPARGWSSYSYWPCRSPARLVPVV